MKILMLNNNLFLQMMQLVRKIPHPNLHNLCKLDERKIPQKKITMLN